MNLRGILLISIRSCLEKNWNPESMCTWKVLEGEGRLSEEHNERIRRKFTMELGKVVREMKTNTVSRPDGFTVSFFKEFWECIKQDILEMLHCLHPGNLDLARLNHGTLPKVKGAVNMRQYRPICLLNVRYRIITKTLTLRRDKRDPNSLCAREVYLSWMVSSFYTKHFMN